MLRETLLKKRPPLSFHRKLQYYIQLYLYGFGKRIWLNHAMKRHSIINGVWHAML